jgi:hypothetical protein
MSHPSATLRGKVLTLPVTGNGDDEALLQAVVDTLNVASPNAPALVTVSERIGSEPQVLTVSGRRQRSLRQWRTLLDAALARRGVTPDWERGLVLRADADTDHGY